MEVKETKPKRKLYRSEIVLYSIFGAIWAFGFIFAIFGILAYNVGKLSVNPFYAMQKGFAAFFGMQGVMDFRLWGSLVMIVAMIAFLIAIFAYTAKSNNEEAARRRKEERRKILMDMDLQTVAATKAMDEKIKEQENEVKPSEM